MLNTNCLPRDGFWNLNVNVAERIWERGDQRTVSHRLAETISANSAMTVAEAKTLLHVIIAAAASVCVGAVLLQFSHELQVPAVAVGVGVGTALYQYLQRDRC